MEQDMSKTDLHTLASYEVEVSMGVREILATRELQQNILNETDALLDKHVEFLETLRCEIAKRMIGVVP